MTDTVTAKAIPSNPPVMLNTTLSVRNWRSISLFFAPTAFLIPISLVLSVTDTSIMFMIPIPPTRRAIPAMLEMVIVNIFVIVPSISRSWVWFCTVKSFFSSVARLCALRSMRSTSYEAWSMVSSDLLCAIIILM